MLFKNIEAGKNEVCDICGAPGYISITAEDVKYFFCINEIDRPFTAHELVALAQTTIANALVEKKGA